MSSTPNPKVSSSKKNKALLKGNVIDFESISLPTLKKYRSQFQIRIKPTVPKSELAAAIAEHFASIPVPEESEVIDQFFKALQKNRNVQSETEDSSDELNFPKKNALSDVKKKSKDHQQEKERSSFNIDSGDIKNLNREINSDFNIEIPKNSSHSNSKKVSKRNSIPKVEKPQSQPAR